VTPKRETPLFARLALSRHLIGGGLGGQLLLDALETVAAAANLAGGRLVVVDAINERPMASARTSDSRLSRAACGTLPGSTP